MCFAFLRLAVAVSEQELGLLGMPPLSLLATGTEETLPISRISLSSML